MVEEAGELYFQWLVPAKPQDGYDLHRYR